MLGGLFGKKEAPKPKTPDQFTPAELKEFQNGLKKQIRDAARELDRSIFKQDGMLREAQRDLEKSIKEGKGKNVQRTYAKNVLTAQRGKDKMIVNKTKLQMVENNINQMVLTLKMGSVLKQGAQIAGLVNQMVNVPELANTMGKLQSEMDKHGVIAEAMDDAMDMVDDNVDADTEAEKLIDKMTDEANAKMNKAKVPAQGQKTEDLDAAIKNLTS